MRKKIIWTLRWHTGSCRPGFIFLALLVPTSGIFSKTVYVHWIGILFTLQKKPNSWVLMIFFQKPHDGSIKKSIFHEQTSEYWPRRCKTIKKKWLFLVKCEIFQESKFSMILFDDEFDFEFSSNANSNKFVLNKRWILSTTWNSDMALNVYGSTPINVWTQHRWPSIDKLDLVLRITRCY